MYWYVIPQLFVAPSSGKPYPLFREPSIARERQQGQHGKAVSTLANFESGLYFHRSMSTVPTAAVPFGVIAPGRPVISEFRVIDSSKCVTEIVNPKDVDEVVFFLLPSSPVPPGNAAVLYFSVPNPMTGVFENWEVLGAVAAAKQSGVFRTGWSTNEQIRNCSVAQLGVSIESDDVVANLRLGAGGVQDRKQFALKIAKDLFQFMSSFSQNTQAGPEVMVVPTNVLDRWITRFESKYSRDPNFMLKD